MNSIKIGLISVGQHCQTNIIPSLNDMPNVEIVGFNTRNVDLALLIAKKYNINYFKNLDKMLALPAIDFVYISSPNAIHYEFILKALANNINVIVEKTAVTKLEHAKEIISIANKKNLLVYEAFMYKHHEQFIRLKKILEHKTYGKARKVFINFGFPHLSKNDIRYSKELDGGALFDAGAYTISAMNELFDYCEHESSNIDLEGSTVDISGHAVFRTSGNVECFLNWGFGLGYKNEIQIWTNEQTIIVDRAFSKRPDYSAKIYTVKDGVINTDSSFACNHFQRMFHFVCNLDRSKYLAANNDLVNQMLKIDLMLKSNKNN